MRTFSLALLVLAPLAALAQSSGSGSAATSKSASAASAASSGSAAVASGSASGSAAGASASAAAALSPCALSCASLAAANSTCNVATNVTCVCTNADFQFKAASCLQTECQASEMGAALGLQNSQCGAASLSATAAPTATAPFTPPNSAADISASGAQSGAPGASSPAPGGALALSTPKGVWLAAGLAVVGGLVGGVLV
ncbi:hypothetical protein C8R43DRAFT_1003674 [Mycena crocata]|nr:hypothetical protein C8R43DRAFT_1003674 [Mycena crocata]